MLSTWLRKCPIIIIKSDLNMLNTLKQIKPNRFISVYTENIPKHDKFRYIVITTFVNRQLFTSVVRMISRYRLQNTCVNV